MYFMRREVKVICYYRYIKRQMAEANECTCNFGTQLAKRGKHTEEICECSFDRTNVNMHLLHSLTNWH